MTGSTITKYYYSGGQRIAMRVNNAVYYLFGDHLGSTSLTTDASGDVISELRYKPWGEIRYNAGVTPTEYQFTGQFSYESQFGLYYFNARWLDPAIGRFAQADTIIPEQSQGTQAWDRYAFVNNNPVRYTDPSGHDIGFPPNPFKYDTLSIGFHGILKELIGIDVDVEIVVNWKAIKERDFHNFDSSINIGGNVSGGVSLEDAVGLEIYGHDGTVLDQSGFQLIFQDGQIPVNSGGCVENICGTSLYTFDFDDPDRINGEGAFLGVGVDPLGLDISADIVGGSDWVLYQKSGEQLKFQMPFVNRKFIKTVPLLEKFIQ